MKLQKIILGILLLFPLSCSQTKVESTELDFSILNSDDLKLYIEKNKAITKDISYWVPIWNYYSEKGDYNEIIQEASNIFHNAAQNKDTSALQYSGAYLAQAYLFKEDLDSLQHYINQISLYNIESNPELRIFYNNILGIYHLKAEKNYSQSIEYFIKAYKLAENDNSKFNQVIILSNIAKIYYLRKDSSGIEYSRKALNIAKEDVSSYAMCLAYTSYAQSMHLKKENDSAIFYLDKAKDLALEDKTNHSLTSSIYLVLANIYAQTQGFIKSDYYYNLALEHSSYSEPGTITEILLNYGNLMYKDRRFKDALKLYEQGLNISYHYKNVEFREDLLMNISKTYSTLGNTSKSNKYYRECNLHKDSILNERRERDFNNLKFHEQKIEHDKEIRKKEIEVIRANERAILYIGVLAITLLIVVFAWILYKRKLKTYSTLVKQHQIYMNRDLFNNESVSQDEVDINDKELFLSLEHLMREEKIFKQNDISLDKVSEMLSTNRSYLSKAINSQSKMSFFNYINMYRVKEAIYMLSKSDFDITLKQLSDELGYNSLSVFYRGFQKETGCTPSRYRTELLKSNKNNIDIS